MSADRIDKSLLSMIERLSYVEEWTSAPALARNTIHQLRMIREAVHVLSNELKETQRIASVRLERLMQLQEPIAAAVRADRNSTENPNDEQTDSK